MKAALKRFLFLEHIGFIILFIFSYYNFKSAIDLNYLGEVMFFIVILFITNNISKFLKNGSDIIFSINLPIIIPAIIVLGPFWAGIIAMIGTITIKGKRDFFWYKFTFNRSIFFLATVFAAIVYNFCFEAFNSNLIFLPLLLAAFTYFLINNGLVYWVVQLASGKKQKSSLLLYYFELAKNLILSYFLGVLFYYSYIHIGKLFFVLSVVLIYIIKDFAFSRMQQLNCFTQIVESFLKVIDSKDQYTEGHCQRVANYTKLLCQELNLTRSKTESIVNMAKIHDIGKINIPDPILKSSDLLTDAEYEEMKKHSQYGYQLLKDIDLLKRELKIILEHHERYDGQGYPHGKKGEEISIGARILSVCDAFDVMTTGRSYKPARSRNGVIKELKDCAGGQFDPKIAREMITLIEKGRFDESFSNNFVREKNIEYNRSLTVNNPS